MGKRTANRSNRRDFIKRAGSTAAALSIIPWRSIQAAPPVWSIIPDQVWVVGTPVSLDLADYVEDPDADFLTISLDNALPDGVTLNGTVISGTPNAPSAAMDYVASADDGVPAPTNFKVE